ncbi:MAG: hypothetical protein H7306_20950 [Bacteriovorax sp.]|nr:hypothetical protein [Rhizobacter sp.]
MKAMFGVVGLLIALAIVGLLAANQLKATAGHGLAAEAIVGARAASVLNAAPGSTVREAATNAQQKVQDDVTKALEQGMAARASSPDQ